MSKQDRSATLSDNAMASRANNGTPLPDEDHEAIRSERAELRAREIDLVRTKLAASADGHLSRAASKLIYSPGAAGGRLGDQDYKAFQGAVAHAVRLSTLDRELRTLEKQYRRQIIDTRPRDAYAKGSPHSWVRDCLAASDTSGDTRHYEPGWEDRLQRHAAIVAKAVDKRSKYGRQVLAARGQELRSANVEQNRKVVERAERDYLGLLRESRAALTTGGGATASASGGGVAAFVPPAILLDQFATFRSPFASFASQLNDSVDLPAWGMQVYIPVITAATSVATATEGSGTSEADPTMGFANGAVVQKSGQVTVSQAVLDRVGPGIGGDQVIFAQLNDQLAAGVDLYALQQALAGAATVTNGSAFALATASGVGGFAGDLKKAKSKLTDTAGVRLRATHAFGVDDLVDYVLAWADAQGRPWATPALDDNRLPIRSAGDQMAQGYSGHVVGGLALFGDSNIPASGSNTQVIVCRPDTILLLEGQPVTYVRPQYQAGNLEPIVGVYEYLTAIAKFPTGVAAISGSAYAAATFA